LSICASNRPETSPANNRASSSALTDAKDESAAEFYSHHGFRATVENPLFLYLPPVTVKGLVKSS
jgi:hypothetical protein